ncbi:hypothetical protein D8Y20_13505, partial [Mariprofundus sp. EBB-1]|uniref:cytochrome C assembly family protein n=1 Tax=Mariprofundus sp. EBB-1 TaxID=2650971 RepID=UPI000EF22764
FAASIILWNNAMHWNVIPIKNQPRSITGLLWGAVALNVWAIHIIDPVTVNGINFTLATGVSMATLMSQVIYGIGVSRHSIRGLGLLLLPFTAISLLLIPILPNAHSPNWIQTSSFLETGHILISLLAYGTLTFATILAFLQKLMDRSLKAKRLTLLMKAIPSLQASERHMMAQIKFSTILLTLSVITGLTWQWVDFHHFGLLHHKILLSIFSLGVLILLQIKRRRMTWPVSTVCNAVIGAYIMLMLAYFGVKLVQTWLS